MPADIADIASVTEYAHFRQIFVKFVTRSSNEWSSLSDFIVSGGLTNDGDSIVCVGDDGLDVGDGCCGKRLDCCWLSE